MSFLSLSSSAQVFITIHTTPEERADWQKAAQIALEEIARCKAMPKTARPLMMHQPDWDSIEQEIRAMAEGKA